MTEQSYAPYRASLLSKSELAALSRLRPAIAVRDTLWRWLIIIAFWISVASIDSLWWTLLAVIGVGTQLYALIIIAHDGLHRRLFSSVESNDRWNDWAILGSIGAITRVNRRNHMTHHRTLALSEDPDSFKYLPAGRESPIKLIWSLTAIPLIWRAATNVLNPTATKSRSTGERHSTRDFVVILSWQVVLIGGLSWQIGWWAYPTLWLMPLGMALVMDMARVFCEHSLESDQGSASSSMRLASFAPTWMERVFLAPQNMNHHIAHHLWPSIPYYHLPEAEKLIKSRHPSGTDIQWRGSYIEHVRAYANQLGSMR
jgi:fatty acid desaturase